MLVFFKCYCSLEPKLCINLIISQLFLVEKLSVYNNVYQLPTNENGDVRRGRRDTDQQREETERQRQSATQREAD